MCLQLKNSFYSCLLLMIKYLYSGILFLTISLENFVDVGAGLGPPNHYTKIFWTSRFREFLPLWLPWLPLVRWLLTTASVAEAVAEASLKVVEYFQHQPIPTSQNSIVGALISVFFNDISWNDLSWYDRIFRSTLYYILP